MRQAATMRSTSAFPALFFTALLSLGSAASTHATKARLSATPSPDHERPRTVRELEDRVRPYLEIRAGLRVATRGTRLSRPSQEELYALMRSWASLSPQTQALYAQATAVPSGMRTFATPGGHCEILYTDTGLNRVDPADRYGYSQSDWRARTSVPNGIPDYVDETGWACDSAWSMEVDRYAFEPPLPLVSGPYSSSLYKVAILNLDSLLIGGDTVLTGELLYGQTLPAAPAEEPDLGFSSHFEIRHNWYGQEWRNVAGNNYEAEPLKAIRITCAHEFLHGVQYAMAREVRNNVYIDDFPLSWIEATAVLMEELSHSDVNDFVQYCGSYFSNPGAALFGQGGGYGSSVAAIYLYEFCPGGAGIEFIRQTFRSSSAASIAFERNLALTSEGLSSQWRHLLGAFHTASYYTGARAVPGAFIADAALLPQWSVPASLVAPTTTVRAGAFAMSRVRRVPQVEDSDTMTVQMRFQRASRADSLWDVNVLLRRGGAVDTTIHFSPGPGGVDTLRIADWKSYSDAVFLVTNANYSATGDVTFGFDTPVPVPVSAVKLAAFPNPFRLGGNAGLTIRAASLSAVRVYSSGGSIVGTWKAAPKATSLTIDQQTIRARMAPGTYTLVVEHDSDTNRRDQNRLTLLVLP